jgi:hypothetical protein
MPSPRHSWTFTRRFRARGFGWRSQPAIKRVKEAVSEIKKVARRDPLLGGEGAVRFLEKVSPALERVDSSSGSIGAAVTKAIDALVPLIAQAPADDATRDKWLDRLWAAYQDDQIPYIERLGDHWGALTATPERASRWADTLLPALRDHWADRGRGYFKGTPVCLGCLLAAGRHQELLALLEAAPMVWWEYRRWGVQALAALGRVDEALAYAEASMGRNDHPWRLANTCEALLIDAGRSDEAYARFGLLANERGTHLATFRALKKRYPRRDPDALLADLIRTTPGEEGKWFAAAKSAKRFELAAALAARSPCDPRTLNRAARDHAESHPEFALSVALSSLRWMAGGWGYEITSLEVRDAFRYAMDTAARLDRAEATRTHVRALAAADTPPARFVRGVLSRALEASP